MLNDLYGVKTDNEKNDVDTMHARGNSNDKQTMRHSDDDETAKCADSAIPSTLSSDCACNSDTYNCKVGTEGYSDGFMVDLMPPYTCNSGDDMKDVEVSHCQDQSLNAEIQSNAILSLHCNTHGTLVTQPTNQPVHEHAPENQDPYPYVSSYDSSSFADTRKGYTADSGTDITFSTDYVQETNVTIKYI